MNNKQSKAGNWLKAIAAIISFIAGLLTGGNTDLVNQMSNFFNF